MTKTLLLLTLLLVAPVAGAYQGFHCKDCTLTDVHTNQDQPAEEAKPEVLTESEACERLDRTGNLSDTIIVKDNCPKIDCGLNNPSGKMCSLDLATGCVVYVEQSDAEKWREECDSKIASIKSFQEYGLKISSDSWAEVNVYCTRALIEEMRNN